jgi:hypothetical protein
VSRNQNAFIRAAPSMTTTSMSNVQQC